MPARRFTLQPVDETFFDSAPLRLIEAFEIPLPATRVWGDLTCELPFSWCKLLRSVTWTSPRPFGVGTTRTARTLASASVLDERYFRWEEGRRKSFYAVQANLPAFRRLAEDYLVEPTSATTCRFTWTIALESHPLARAADPASRLLLSTLFGDTRRYYRAT